MVYEVLQRFEALVYWTKEVWRNCTENRRVPTVFTISVVSGLIKVHNERDCLLTFYYFIYNIQLMSYLNRCCTGAHYINNWEIYTTIFKHFITFTVSPMFIVRVLNINLYDSFRRWRITFGNAPIWNGFTEILRMQLNDFLSPTLLSYNKAIIFACCIMKYLKMTNVIRILKILSRLFIKPFYVV